MSTSAMKILCRYQYDPLDRLTGLKPAEHLDTQRFYQNDELVNEIEGQVELTLLRHETQPLAQRITNANVTETTLLATDQQRSVLQTLAGTDTQPMAYTAYGHRSTESGLSSLLGFNGERPDPFTGHYLLGQGNRAFNPVLMRFNSPDVLSPFGDGGINAYAYCGGDPVNRYDPSGNIPLRLWDIPMKNKIFRPWEQPKALNLSSKAISRAKHQTATGQAIASLLRPSVSTSAPTVPATPKPIPFERASSNIKVRSTKAEAQAQTTRREKARAYDAHVQKNPNFKIKENSTLRANFETASSHYSSFKQEKDHLIAELGTNEYYKQYRDALSRYQNTRITLKISNLSILEETIKQTRRQ